jgi:predicted small secreted protein
VQGRFSRSVRAAAIVVAGTLVLSACATVVGGKPSVQVAPNATLNVVGDSGQPFDTTVKNALSDVLAFWKIN